jgi:hypothetical protein
MKRAKQKTPKKKMRNKRAIYSLAPKKKAKAEFQYANGGHTKGGNGVLREDATAYHTHFNAVLDAAPPPVLEIETPIADEAPPLETSEELAHIERLNSAAETRWADKLCVDSSLTRALVSFQANKGRAVYRWFKYKEAFSAGLIEHLLLNTFLKSIAKRLKMMKTLSGYEKFLKLWTKISEKELRIFQAGLQPSRPIYSSRVYIRVRKYPSFRSLLNFT